MDPDFSNREISSMFTEVKTLLHGQNKVLEEIKTQVKLTNGRVSLLELWKEGLMARFATGITALGLTWIAIKEFFLK